MPKSYSRAFSSAVISVALLCTLPAPAGALDRKGSSFAILPQPAAPGQVQTAKANRAFVRLEVRPVLAVTLAEAIPRALAETFGAKADVPLDTSRQLYGWPERPGLFCDLLRPRGLGLSSACLRDTDQDGKFDEGIRLDFNSGHADLLVISHSGKIIGANFTKTRVPLPRAVAYAPTTPAVSIPGKLALQWKPNKRAGPNAVQLWMSTPENYTGTEGLSEKVLVFDRSKAPIDVELYGVKLRIHGFDADGAMRYSLEGVTEGAAVPLLFRGYVFRIISY